MKIEIDKDLLKEMILCLLRSEKSSDRDIAAEAAKLLPPPITTIPFYDTKKFNNNDTSSLYG